MLNYSSTSNIPGTTHTAEGTGMRKMDFLLSCDRPVMTTESDVI